MTTPTTVIDTLEVMRSSGLEYTPREIGKLIDVWVNIFSDIPDDIFRQSVNDYLRLETRWPAPAMIRRIADKVKLNNNKTISGGRFSPAAAGKIDGYDADGTPVEFTDRYPVYRVTPGLWKSYKPGKAQPAELPAIVAEMEAKYQGVDLPTDEEWAAMTAALEG